MFALTTNNLYLVSALKMPRSEIPAFQIPQENPEEDEPIYIQRGAAKGAGRLCRYV